METQTPRGCRHLAMVLYQVWLYGNALLGTHEKDQIFSYQFYMSTDKVVDPTDLDLGYSMRDYRAQMTLVYGRKHVFFSQPSVTERIVSDDDVNLTSRMKRAMFVSCYCLPNCRT